eukprot:TRINITY_DN16524_c1_g1_i1.p1 TRINITY_DN16524_c1_g1~~TRINITY_DN16524_c1_g1_i1.p1  ORF type:complete len:331 (-),score=19.13 TRINITY_DN16524_c1_g1_i1:209-1165(-)
MRILTICLVIASTLGSRYDGLSLMQEVQIQHSSLLMSAKSFEEEPSCQAYCNGEQVVDLEEPVCYGIFYLQCKFVSEHEDVTRTYTCIGSFNRTKTPDVAHVYCSDGSMSTTTDGEHMGEEATVYFMSAYSCAGHSDVAYNLHSTPPSAALFDAQGQEVNYTCHGAQGASMKVSDHKIISLLTGQQRGFQPQEYDPLQVDVQCNATCGEDSVDTYGPVTCLTKFDEKCDIEVHGCDFQFGFSCEGIRSGYIKAEACLGKHKEYFGSSHSKVVELCSKDYGVQRFQEDGTSGSYSGCHGESLISIQYFGEEDEEKIFVA